MDAVKFLEELERMCLSFDKCDNCPIMSDSGFCRVNNAPYNRQVQIDEIVFIVEKWSAEHPVKTRLMDLLEKFPKFSMGTNNLPMVLPRLFGYCGRGRCQGCEHQNEEESCWNLPLEE